jgi:hypothetical protein
MISCPRPCAQRSGWGHSEWRGRELPEDSSEPPTASSMMPEGIRGYSNFVTAGTIGIPIYRQVSLADIIAGLKLLSSSNLAPYVFRRTARDSLDGDDPGYLKTRRSQRERSSSDLRQPI